jgi:lycopene cyclase domain-containing protein
MAINLGSIAIPLIYSFERSFRFIRNAKVVFSSLVLVAIPFLVWDALFTAHGVWGFNPEYYLGPKLVGLPIEEVLFFICIPYACVFTHYALFYYFKDLSLPPKIVKLISALLFLTVLSLAISYKQNSYTVINAIPFLLLIGYSWFKKNNHLSRFYISFAVILLPFFLVNGILTGSFITDEVVWYNPDEIIGLRLGTIPVEDIIYCFSLLYANILIIEYLKRKARYILHA